MSYKQLMKRVDRVLKQYDKLKAYEAKPLETKIADLQHKRDQLRFHIQDQQLKLDAVNKELERLEELKLPAFLKQGHFSAIMAYTPFI